MAIKRKTAARRGAKKAARTKKAAAKKTAARKTAVKKTVAKKKTATRRTRVVEPKASGTLGVNGSRSRGTRDFDLLYKPSGTLGASVGVDRAAPPATLGLPPSLSLRQAASIVLAAAGQPQGDLDASLEEAGLITDSLRRDFRQRVFEGVRAAAFEISPGAIPVQPGTTLGEVADAVQAKAR